MPKDCSFLGRNANQMLSVACYFHLRFHARCPMSHIWLLPHKHKPYLLPNTCGSTAVRYSKSDREKFYKFWPAYKAGHLCQKSPAAAGNNLDGKCVYQVCLLSLPLEPAQVAPKVTCRGRQHHCWHQPGYLQHCLPQRSWPMGLVRVVPPAYSLQGGRQGNLGREADL